MKKPKKFSPEVRKRAVHLVLEHRGEYAPASKRVRHYNQT